MFCPEDISVRNLAEVLPEWGLDIPSDWSLKIRVKAGSDFWIHRQGQLYRKAPGAEKVLPVAEVPGIIRSVDADGDDFCLVTDSLLYLSSTTRPEEVRTIAHGIEFHRSGIWCARDGEGNVWVGSEGLYRFQKGTLRKETVLDNILVMDILRNRAGAILVATGNAGIYYHLSYHGDPASWIWLCPLSPAFISTELTKAYTYGARKIWVFNVGDIKPAEKEITFAMELAWDIDLWSPEKAHGFIAEWAARTFGTAYAREIAAVMDGYYRLMASGKDSHVWFLEYPETEIRARIDTWRKIADQALALEKRIPAELQPAYFELVLYPVRGAQMINEYQLLARTSLAHASAGEREQALADAARAKEMYAELDAWTCRYNDGLLDGKWKDFFNWKPYHWFRSPVMDAPIAGEEMLEAVAQSAAPRFLPVAAALSAAGAAIDAETACELPLWIHALTPVRNFSKAAADNVFCRVNVGGRSSEASATPVNNVWHATSVGPMWSQVGTVHLAEGKNTLKITELKPDARIGAIFLGFYPPFPDAPVARIPAEDYAFSAYPVGEGRITTVSGLGYSDGVLVLPFGTPSYDTCAEAPYVSYRVDLPEGADCVEVRTLADLHVYAGRGDRYAVQVDEVEPQVFDIHTDDFSAEWRWNVLRGYSCRRVDVSGAARGPHEVKVYFLDPGIVLQEICVFGRK